MTPHAMDALDGPVESSLVCLYTLTSDEHFVIDILAGWAMALAVHFVVTAISRSRRRTS